MTDSLLRSLDRAQAADPSDLAAGIALNAERRRRGLELLPLASERVCAADGWVECRLPCVGRALLLSIHLESHGTNSFRVFRGSSALLAFSVDGFQFIDFIGIRLRGDEVFRYERGISRIVAVIAGERGGRAMLHVVPTPWQEWEDSRRDLQSVLTVGRLLAR